MNECMIPTPVKYAVELKYFAHGNLKSTTSLKRVLTHTQLDLKCLR